MFAGFFSTCTMKEMENEENGKRVSKSAEDTTKAPYFFYYNGEKQYLELDTRYMFVSVADEETANSFALDHTKSSSFRIDISEGMRSKTQYKRYWATLSMDDKLSEVAYLEKLSGTRSTEKNIITAPYFKGGDLGEIGLSNLFYVKLKSLNDYDLLCKEAVKENAVVVYQNEYLPLWYMLSVTVNSNCNAMEMANRFYESGLFACAEPDLMYKLQFSCANDQFFGQQWNLRNIGQSNGKSGVDIKICDAWQFSTGAGITVAVVDAGIQFNPYHPDLAANMHVSSFDCETGALASPVPQVVYAAHGTQVAGVIGALRNNVVGSTTIGIAGVAPDAKLMSVSNSGDATTASMINRAIGISWAVANGADVINCSWGWQITGSSPYITYTQLNDAISDAVANGRNGKGCVVVFAAGNENSSTVHYPASLSNVIAVGAINRNGQRWVAGSGTGSNYGTDLDVVAPGVDIVTTTTGSGYTNSTPVSGTSYAAPHVAGIAALILSYNPNLTEPQVRMAIQQTFTKSPVLPYTFSSNPSRPHGDWNTDVRYGLVNAAWAVVKSAGGYKVSFDLNYSGAGTPPADQYILNNGIVTKPSPDPFRSGYTFGGWYTNSFCSAGSEFNFSSHIASNITLYAKWTATTISTGIDLSIFTYNLTLQSVSARLSGSVGTSGLEFFSLTPNSAKNYLV